MGVFVKTFAEINKDMVQECGGKAAHLGELTSMGINVPNGFCVVAEAFYHHLKSNNLNEQILNIAEGLNYDDLQNLEEKTSAICSLIETAPLPPEIEKEITGNYECLSKEDSEPFVAVRSSVAVKNAKTSSFPGMMDTYHYIRGSRDVVENVRKCFASVWSARAAFARHEKGIDHRDAIIAPVVQLMVNSEIAGVLFTVNPISGEKGEIIIESNWGLGESVVSGKAVSDLYIVDKKSYKAKETRIARKETAFVKAAGSGGEWVSVEPDKVNKPTLADVQLKELCKTALAIEGHYGCPQDIEWAYEKNILYILQARRAKVGGE